jgi:hypothetical protein
MGAVSQIASEARAVLLGSKLNILLLPLPLALASPALGWPAGATLMLALVPLCSLAEVSACAVGCVAGCGRTGGRNACPPRRPSRANITFPSFTPHYSAWA